MGGGYSHSQALTMRNLRQIRQLQDETSPVFLTPPQQTTSCSGRGKRFSASGACLDETTNLLSDFSFGVTEAMEVVVVVAPYDVQKLCSHRVKVRRTLRVPHNLFRAIERHTLPSCPSLRNGSSSTKRVCAKQLASLFMWSWGSSDLFDR